MVQYFYDLNGDEDFNEMFIYDEEYDSELKINGTGDSENNLGNLLFIIFNYSI